MLNQNDANICLPLNASHLYISHAITTSCVSFGCVRGVRLLMVGRDIVLAVSALTSIDYWSNRKDLADLFFGGGLFITIAVVSIAPWQDCGATGRDTCG
jgi:hypothetical protein